MTFNGTDSQPNVNINDIVRATSVAVSGSTSYTFTGSGSITGLTGVTVNGSGVLTVANTNSYTGGTFVQSGTLALGINNALPVAGALVLGSSGSSKIV